MNHGRKSRSSLFTTYTALLVPELERSETQWLTAYLSKDPGVGPHGILQEGGGAGGHQDEQVCHREVKKEQVGAATQELKGRETGENPSLMEAKGPYTNGVS